MNLFSKTSFTLCLLRLTLTLAFTSVVGAPSAQALNLSAIYTVACKRDLGVIMHVDDHDIRFLTTKGKLKKIPRYEVIFWAQYPVDTFPYSGTVNLGNVAWHRIVSKQGNQLVDLVEGWPTGFTRQKIAFLTTSGQEFIVDREAIWEVHRKPTGKTRFTSTKSNQMSSRYYFVPPHMFSYCPNSKKKGSQTLSVFPQQILSDPITIKREFDFLKAGYDKIKRYDREQDFYAVPMLYGNKTSLGIWHNFQSRYGGASKRGNNLTPVLTDEYSSDVFDYQQIFITGSAPIPKGVHEEGQTQAYYSFKASYFHLSAMMDPNLILVGQNYEWQASDFDSTDDRVNDSGFLEMGFDFGYWSIQLHMVHSVNLGVYHLGNFHADNLPLGGLGLKFQNHWLMIEAMGASGKESDKENTPEETFMKMNWARLNVFLNHKKRWTWQYSLIHRKFDFEGPFQYSSTSLSNAIYAAYQWNYRFDLKGYVAVESHAKDFGINSLDESESEVFPKLGTSISISF